MSPETHIALPVELELTAIKRKWEAAVEVVTQDGARLPEQGISEDKWCAADDLAYHSELENLIDKRNYSRGKSMKGPIRRSSMQRRISIGVFLMILTLAAWASLAQTPDDSKPASTNVGVAQYPRVSSDARVTFRVKAPDA